MRRYVTVSSSRTSLLGLISHFWMRLREGDDLDIVGLTRWTLPDSELPTRHTEMALLEREEKR
jgi:hypothetical protein